MSEENTTDASLAVQNLWTVRASIAQACADFGRDTRDVTLTAVSKTMGADVIAQTILAGGQRVFGENRVQEAASKWPQLRALALNATPDKPITLHLIGPLQTNKISEALDLFDMIETLDREKLAVGLAKELCKRSGKPPRLLVQVNTGAEPQKAGILPENADSFIAFCQNLGLTLDGLMCIPPADAPPSPHFALLRKIAARHGLQTLSMGMSSDYTAAIQMGATHVRIGSGIFGARV